MNAEEWTRQTFTAPDFAYGVLDPVGTLPSDPGTPLWRYMNLPKLILLLGRQALYFARLDRLGDPFEGSLTATTRAERVALHQNVPRVLHSLSEERIRTVIENTIVSCWYAREFESDGMWRTFAPNGLGVAIRSTMERLTTSLPAYDGQSKGRNDDGSDREIALQLGVVRYVDYNAPDAPSERDYPRWLLKRQNFDQEREVRVVAQDWSFQGELRPSRFPSGGAYVPVNLGTLIEAVHIAPDASPSFIESVTSVVKQYGCAAVVRSSDLSRAPSF